LLLTQRIFVAVIVAHPAASCSLYCHRQCNRPNSNKTQGAPSSWGGKKNAFALILYIVYTAFIFLSSLSSSELVNHAEENPSTQEKIFLKEDRFLYNISNKKTFVDCHLEGSTYERRPLYLICKG